MTDIYSFLQLHGITFEKFEHQAVFTIEEAEKLLPEMPGSKVKNLFLKDGKGARMFLVIVPYHKSVDLKELRRTLGVDKLSFGAPDIMKELLGVDPGSATLLGVMNDLERKVQVVFDQDIWDENAFQFHPLINTSTLVISKEDIAAFLTATGHEAEVIEVPTRAQA